MHHGEPFALDVFHEKFLAHLPADALYEFRFHFLVVSQYDDLIEIKIGQRLKNTRTMLAIGSEKSVGVYSLETFEALTELTIKPKGVYAVAFSPDTEWLVAASADKKIRVWAVDSII